MRMPIIWFPVAAVVFSLFAYWQPQLLTGFKPAILPLLGIIMFGMGMTLTPASFMTVFRRPGVVALGLLLQYSLMPLIAWGLGHWLNLPLAILTGLVLVGSCPGGTASNVICYLARGNVALSITLTSCSTLLSVVMTPLLTWFLIGQQVPVPVISMLLDIVLIIIIPVTAGLLLRQWFTALTRTLECFFAPLSMVAIVVIIGIIVALSRDQIAAVAGTVLLAVVLHNMLGLAAGYGLARLSGYSARIARTLAIEVGMQNSGLGVALAMKYFTPVSALPGALFSIWHNLSGALLAALWSRQDNVYQNRSMNNTS